MTGNREKQPAALLLQVSQSRRIREVEQLKASLRSCEEKEQVICEGLERLRAGEAGRAGMLAESARRKQAIVEMEARVDALQAEKAELFLLMKHVLRAEDVKRRKATLEQADGQQAPPN